MIFITLGLILSISLNGQAVRKIKIEKTFIESYWSETTKFDTIISRKTYYLNGDWSIEYQKYTNKNSNVIEAVAMITLDSSNAYIFRKFILYDSTLVFSKLSFGGKHLTVLNFDSDTIPTQVQVFEIVNKNDYRLIIDQVFDKKILPDFSDPSRWIEFEYSSYFFNKYNKVVMYELNMNESKLIPFIKTVHFLGRTKTYDYFNKYWRLNEVSKFKKGRMVKREDLVLDYKTLYFYNDSLGMRKEELWAYDRLVESRITYESYEEQAEQNLNK